MDFNSLIYFFFFFFIFTPLYILLRKYVLRRKNHSISYLYECGLFFFFTAIFVILYFTILPNFLMINEKVYVSFKEENHHTNIIPFKTIKDLIDLLKSSQYFYYAFTNLFGNILLFVPFSFLFYCLFYKMHGIFILLISVLFSVTIELIQLPMQRISDIDDIILNSLGALIGVLLGFLVVKKKIYNS